MWELASSSSCSVDVHDHTDSLCEELLFEEYQPQHWFPSSSALRVLTLPQPQKQWDPKDTKNESSTNLHVQANLITQLLV